MSNILQELCLNMIINMLFYLINLEMGKISFLFEFGYIIFRRWGKLHLPLDIFAYNITYIQTFYIALLSYAIAYI